MTKQQKSSVVEILQISRSCEARTLICAILKHFANLVAGGGGGGGWQGGIKDNIVVWIEVDKIARRRNICSAIHGVKLCI